MHLLLIEDDPDLCRSVADMLTRAKYVVDTASDGEEGGYLGATGDYDAIILDLGLPVVDGSSVLSDWRENGMNTPVLVLTARTSWRDKVNGLRGGADDYLTKPFQPEELLARVEALIRRSRGQGASITSLGSVEIDRALQTVSVDGREIALGPNEYRALAYLTLNRGKVVSKTTLAEHVYQDFDLDSNVIEVMIARLRKKLGVDLVRTRRGHGYYVE